MPDSVHPKLRRISHTPLRDVLRFRFTGRLDWKLRLANSGLPKPAADLIRRVVKRTRLWRLERAGVADELVAHFADGMEAGSNVEQLIKSFGDERVAAKLIRRAKRRSRPWPWQFWNVSFRVMAVVLAIYAVLLIRFCVGQPTISVDYVAEFNAPIVAVAPSDRAWPVWRQAILACADRDKTGGLAFAEAIYNADEPDMPWSETTKWLDQHVQGIELARQAGQMPALGFVLGPGGSADNPLMPFPSLRQKPFTPGSERPAESVVDARLPHLDDLWRIGDFLSHDAKLAAERGEGVRTERDLMAMFGLARQLRTAEGFLVSQLVGIGIDNSAIRRLRTILFTHPQLLKDDQLIRIAHEISGPRVAADLMGLKREREAFADIVQRSYTDDGRGDGHMTLVGLRFVSMHMGLMADSKPLDSLHLAAASALWVFSVSRAELMTQFNRLMDQAEANFRQPVREVDVYKVQSQINAIKDSPIHLIRFGMLADFTSGFSRVQSSGEQYLGNRDGVVVGIALELHRRRHGHYPVALSELTPDLLPEVPADRITGDPVKYKLIDGKPVVYSVGVDRIDDGGKPPNGPDSFRREDAAAQWGIDPQRVPRGDWLLFAPDPPDAQDH
jgi:hypothetical protein